jgi:hypothetical protein
VLTMALDESGNFGYRPLLEAMYSALLDMVEEGLSARRRLSGWPSRPSDGAVQISWHRSSRTGGSRAFRLSGWRCSSAKIDSGTNSSEGVTRMRSVPDGPLSRVLRSSRRLPPAWRLAVTIHVPVTFVDRLEAKVMERLAAAPERMLIPLGKMLLVKERT